MHRIGFRDFVPPIIPRAISHFKRKESSIVESVQPMRIHPFDAIPKNINAKWVLDVGANRGDVAIAALISYPEAHVICFEPVKETFEEISERLTRISHT